MSIRPAVIEDIDRLTEIHIGNLPADTLLVELGSRFLQEAFYPSVFEDEKTHILVSEEAGQLHGFLIFSENVDNFNKQLSSHKMAIARAIVVNPLVFLKLLGYLFRSTDPGLSARILHLPEFYLMAVESDCQRKGIGRQLMMAGAERLAVNHQACFLKTRLEGPRLFFERLGYQVIGTERRGFSVLYIMGKSL